MANTSIYNAFERMWEHTNNAIDNAIDAIESDTLVVTADTTNNTASHSASEIKAAYDAGKNVVLRINDMVLNYYGEGYGGVSFGHVYASADRYVERYYYINEDKSIQIQNFFKNFVPTPSESTNGKYLQSTERK